MRCLAECPKRQNQLHACDIKGTHSHHHCLRCGAEWDENLRASKRLVQAVAKVLADREKRHRQAEQRIQNGTNPDVTNGTIITQDVTVPQRGSI